MLAFDTHTYIKELQEAIEEYKASTKRDLKELELTLLKSMKELELRLTLRLGGMLVMEIVATLLLVDPSLTLKVKPSLPW